MMAYWLVLPVVILGGVAAVLLKNNSVKPSANAKAVDKDFVASKLAEIELMTRGTGSQLKQSVIEADKLLDYCLRQMGYKGETMAQRLGAVRKQLTDEQGVWNAHRLRNRLVHEADMNLMGDMAPKAVASLKQAMRDLGAL